ncbi:PDZ domain-containing protein [Paenibacillus sp. JTLBN-2024]
METNVTQGAVVVEVTFKSPAYEADLRPYDIITGVDSINVKTHTDIVNYIQKQKVGAKVTLHVVRNGKKMDMELTIGDKNKYNIPSEDSNQ